MTSRNVLNRSLICRGPSYDYRVIGESRSAEWALHEALQLPEGFFPMESPTGVRRFGALAGHTIRRFGLDCPVVNVFDIETDVIGEGADAAVWGICGPVASLGICYTRPDNLGG